MLGVYSRMFYSHQVTSHLVVRGIEGSCSLCPLPKLVAFYAFAAKFGYNKHYYSTKVNTNKIIEPEFISGFVDGEGCFGLLILKQSPQSSKWKVRLTFEIHLHKKDRQLLENIRQYFAVGKVYENQKDSAYYLVQSQEDLGKVIEHFEKYPLLTKKLSDYTI